MSDTTDTTDDPPPEATPAAPGRAMFTGWTVPAAEELRYVLTGPRSPELSTLLAIMVMNGMWVQARAPHARYIVWGAPVKLEKFAELIAAEPGATEAGFTFAREETPDFLWASSEPIRESGYRRKTQVQGPFHHMRGWIAGAIDYRLFPKYAGAGRWVITGPTALQVRWFADVVLRKPLAEAMQELCITQDLLRSEDRDGQPVAINSLPRESITKVQTDDDGNIVQSHTYEFDAAG